MPFECVLNTPATRRLGSRLQIQVHSAHLNRLHRLIREARRHRPRASPRDAALHALAGEGVRTEGAGGGWVAASGEAMRRAPLQCVMNQALHYCRA